MSEATIAQRAPCVKEMEPGKYAWCACGRSRNQPFCDGSHRGTHFSPLIVELTEKTTVSWCCCKHTGNKPYCDGSHSRLPR